MLVPSKIQTVLEMRAAGKGWESIAEAVGESSFVVRAAIDPEWAEDRRRRVRANNRRRKGLPTEKGEHAVNRPVREPLHFATVMRVPEAVLLERERIASIVPTINQAILGDPLPGRSALDKLRAG